MKRESTHNEATAALGAAALDALDADQRDAVLAHVAGCVECRAALDKLRAAASELAFSVASTGDPRSRERIRARLAARAAADTGRPVGTQSPTPVVLPPLLMPVASTPVRSFDAAHPATMDDVSPHRASGAYAMNVLAWRRAEWIALAASILMVVSVGLLAWQVKDRSNLRDALKAQVAIGQSAITSSDSLRVAVASRDSLIAGLTGRDVAVMSLTSSAANAPFGRMFWDQKHNTWTLVAHNMPALKPGRTYQLWLVTASSKISAGTFAVRNGEALVRATYSLAPSDLRALAVTEERAGGVSQPTGAPVIAVTAH